MGKFIISHIYLPTASSQTFLFTVPSLYATYFLSLDLSLNSFSIFFFGSACSAVFWKYFVLNCNLNVRFHAEFTNISMFVCLFQGVWTSLGRFKRAQVYPLLQNRKFFVHYWRTSVYLELTLCKIAGWLAEISISSSSSVSKFRGCQVWWKPYCLRPLVTVVSVSR